MSKICNLCQRQAIIGFSRSHSNRATKRRLKLNLQSRKVNGHKVWLCTSCIKTIKKNGPK